jgi:hypothetical protein
MVTYKQFLQSCLERIETIYPGTSYYLLSTIRNNNAINRHTYADFINLYRLNDIPLFENKLERVEEALQNKRFTIDILAGLVKARVIDAVFNNNLYSYEKMTDGHKQIMYFLLSQMADDIYTIIKLDQI